MKQTPNALWSRTVAALLGGYLCANALSIALTVVVPLDKDDAVVTGMMATFLIYALAIMWAFSTKTARQAWWGLSLATMISATIWFVAQRFGAQG